MYLKKIRHGNQTYDVQNPKIWKLENREKDRKWQGNVRKG